MQRVKGTGVRLKKRKCVFLAPKVVYLGLKTDQNGIRPVPKKVKVIEEMPRASDVKQLQAYLGMVNYYFRFLQNMSAILSPLYIFYRKECPGQGTKSRTGHGNSPSPCFSCPRCWFILTQKRT